MNTNLYTCCACLKVFRFGDFPEHDKKMLKAKEEFPGLTFIHWQYLCEPCANKLVKEMDEDDKRSKANLN